MQSAQTIIFRELYDGDRLPLPISIDDKYQVLRYFAPLISDKETRVLAKNLNWLAVKFAVHSLRKYVISGLKDIRKLDSLNIKIYSHHILKELFNI